MQALQNGKNKTMCNTLQQIHVYEYLGKDSDPLYKAIHCMHQDCPFRVPESNMYFTKTKHGFYELVSNSCHECFTTPEALYRRISDMLNEQLLRRR